MKNLHIDWSSVPDVIKKDHFFGICHISKSTALHSLKSYKVSVSGKARKHNATKSRKRMCGRAIFYYAHSRRYDNHYVAKLSKELLKDALQQMRKYKDVVTVRDVVTKASLSSLLYL